MPVRFSMRSCVRAKSKFPPEVVLLILGFRILGRPFDKHLDSQELNALAPWSPETEGELHFSTDALRAAASHAQFCTDCGRKLSKYRHFVSGLASAAVSEAAPRGADCPKDEGVDWHEVAAGLWPEWKSKKLIMHAALCDHCGPLLRAAARANVELAQEKKLLVKLKATSRPDPIPEPLPPTSRSWKLTRWLVPAAALMLIVVGIVSRPRSSVTPLPGPKFAEFAVRTHRQHARGSLALDVRLDSQQKLNEWFKTKLPFSLALPTSPTARGEEPPFHLEGARVLTVSGHSAAYIAYQTQSGPASLLVTPDSVAIASGGVEAHFKKVTFHYATVEGYKVVTWSLHGQTYALVSQEGNSTQRSCMVCHSAMRDRDLGHTPTPLQDERKAVEPFLQ